MPHHMKDENTVFGEIPTTRQIVVAYIYSRLADVACVKQLKSKFCEIQQFIGIDYGEISEAYSDLVQAINQQYPSKSCSMNTVRLSGGNLWKFIQSHPDFEKCQGNFTTWNEILTYMEFIRCVTIETVLSHRTPMRVTCLIEWLISTLDWSPLIKSNENKWGELSDYLKCNPNRPPQKPNDTLVKSLLSDGNKAYERNTICLTDQRSMPVTPQYQSEQALLNKSLTITGSTGNCSKGNPVPLHTLPDSSIYRTVREKQYLLTKPDGNLLKTCSRQENKIELPINQHQLEKPRYLFPPDIRSLAAPDSAVVNPLTSSEQQQCMSQTSERMFDGESMKDENYSQSSADSCDSNSSSIEVVERLYLLPTTISDRKVYNNVNDSTEEYNFSQQFYTASHFSNDRPQNSPINTLNNFGGELKEKISPPYLFKASNRICNKATKIDSYTPKPRAPPPPQINDYMVSDWPESAFHGDSVKENASKGHHHQRTKAKDVPPPSLITMNTIDPTATKDRLIKYCKFKSNDIRQASPVSMKSKDEPHCALMSSTKPSKNNSCGRNYLKKTGSQTIH